MITPKVATRPNRASLIRLPECALQKMAHRECACRFHFIRQSPTCSEFPMGGPIARSSLNAVWLPYINKSPAAKGGGGPVSASMNEGAKSRRILAGGSGGASCRVCGCLLALAVGPAGGRVEGSVAIFSGLESNVVMGFSALRGLRFRRARRRRFDHRLYWG